MVTIRSHRIPIIRGFLMYLISVIQTIILDHVPITMQITTDEQAWVQKVKYLVLCNGPREGGGFLVAPHARMDDGLIHYVMITDVSRPMMFRLVPEVMKGTHLRFKQVRTGTCKEFSISADRPLYIHADGEIFTSFGSNLKKIDVEILPKALKVVKG